MPPTDAELIELENRRSELRSHYIVPAADRAESPGRGIHHAALICSDVEQTIQFYQGLLGFPLVELVDRQGGQILAKLQIGPGELAKLQQTPIEQILAACAGLPLSPVVEGQVLAAQPFDPVASALSAHVPLVIGTTHDEMTPFLMGAAEAMTEADLTARLTAVLGGAPAAQQAIDLYRRIRPQDSPFYVMVGVLTDRSFTAPSILIAERKLAQAGAPVFMYQSTWRMPSLGGRLRAGHGLDMALAFDNAAISGSMLGDGPQPEALGAVISKAFAAFARTGNPSTALAPPWPAYSAAGRQTMLFDIPPRVAADPGAEARAFWSGKV